jgi:hypothetical protein
VSRFRCRRPAATSRPRLETHCYLPMRQLRRKATTPGRGRQRAGSRLTNAYRAALRTPETSAKVFAHQQFRCRSQTGRRRSDAHPAHDPATTVHAVFIEYSRCIHRTGGRTGPGHEGGPVNMGGSRRGLRQLRGVALRPTYRNNGQHNEIRRLLVSPSATRTRRRTPRLFRSAAGLPRPAAEPNLIQVFERSFSQWVCR